MSTEASRGQATLRYCGRDFSPADLDIIRRITDDPHQPTRAEIARAVCEAFTGCSPTAAPRSCPARSRCSGWRRTGSSGCLCPHARSRHPAAASRRPLLPLPRSAAHWRSSARSGWTRSTMPLRAIARWPPSASAPPPGAWPPATAGSAGPGPSVRPTCHGRRTSTAFWSCRGLSQAVRVSTVAASSLTAASLTARPSADPSAVARRVFLDGDDRLGTLQPPLQRCLLPLQLRQLSPQLPFRSTRLAPATGLQLPCCPLTAPERQVRGVQPLSPQ
jgi:hypothetical protein